VLVGPVALAAAWRVATGRPGADALALAPASYGLYMYTELAITGDLARYDRITAKPVRRLTFRQNLAGRRGPVVTRARPVGRCRLWGGAAGPRSRRSRPR
jgi:hypothetical protein